MLFQKIILSDPTPEITPELAMDCYKSLQNWNTVSESFRQDSRHYFKHLEETMDEAIRIEKLVIDIMKSENKPSSKEELRSMISSDILDCDMVLNDIIDYVVTYEKNTTRDDFISQF